MAVPPPPHPRQGPPHPSFFGMEQMKMEIKLEPEQEQQGGSGGGAVAVRGLNSLWPSNGKYTEYLSYAMTLDNSEKSPKYYVGAPLSVEIVRHPHFQVDIVANGHRINLFNSGAGHIIKNVHADLRGPMYSIRMLVKEQHNKSHILQYYSEHQQDNGRMRTTSLYNVLLDIQNSML